MQISGSGNSPPSLTLRLPPQATSALPLRQGESVTALVVQSTTPGQLTLEIGGKLLQTLSTLQLLAGTTLQLRVEKQNNQLLLRLDEKQLQQLSQQQAMRQTLPRQQPLKQVIEQVVQLQEQLKPAASNATKTAAAPTPTPAAPKTATPPPTAEPLPRGQRLDNRAGDATADAGTARTARTATALPVEKAVARLIAALPTLTRLTSGTGLQQAIAQSGMFIESTLLQGHSPGVVDSDVKTALLRLARSIRQELASGGRESTPTKGERTEGAAVGREQLQALLRQVESGVARVQMHQLNSLASQGQGNERLDLQLELPLFHPQSGEVELLRLRIQREASRRGGGTEPCWSVTLHLDPPDYGAIHAVVSLTGGKVSTTFWCENAQTGELFHNELEQLQQRLDEQGLEVGRCSALVGKPPVSDEIDSAEQDSGLIDTRA